MRPALAGGGSRGVHAVAVWPRRLPLVLAVGVLRWVVRTLPVLLPLVVALLLLLVLLLGGQQDTAVGSR